MSFNVDYGDSWTRRWLSLLSWLHAVLGVREIKRERQRERERKSWSDVYAYSYIIVLTPAVRTPSTSCPPVLSLHL